MQYLYRQYGEQIYNAGFLAQTEQEITAWCEAQGIALNNKNKTKLLDVKTWGKSRRTFQTASTLLEHFGEQQFDDFNQFKQAVECRLKAEKIPFLPQRKGRFQCRKLVRRKFSQSDCQNTQLKPNGWTPFANATNAKPTSWQTLAITPPAKQANISYMKRAATCATANPYRSNKISTTISKPKCKRTSAKHG